MCSKLSTKLINYTFIVLQLFLIIATIVRRMYFNAVGSTLITILIFILLFYEYKKGIIITDFIRCTVYITLLSNSFLGDYMGLYYTSVYFDKALHVFGTFSFSLFLFSIIDKKVQPKKLGRNFLFVYIILLGSFLGTMFEIGEFICDQIFKTVNQTNLIDTNLDMIFNTLGAAIAGAFIVLRGDKL